MFELIVAIIVGLYALQVLIYLLASYKKFSRLPDDQLPSASVIVAVRNEEMIISRCLKALDELNYPEGKLQIVVINDRSTDSTGEIIREFIKGKARFTMVDGIEPIGHLRGKSNALVQGLKVATGDIVITTDADCKVNPLWAKTLASYFKDGVGLLGGMTTQETGSAWKGMQHLDFMYLLGAGSGTINAGLPLSVIGNNMAYLRKAYDETGGYESMPFSVTEDSQILAAISRLKKYKIIYPLDKDSLIESLPVEGFVPLYKQKKRWGIGGLNVPPHGLLVLGTSFFSHLLSMLILPLNPLAGVLSILTIVISDLIFLGSIVYRMKQLHTLKYFLFFEIYYFIYIIFLPFILLFSKSVEWKGRKF